MLVFSNCIVFKSNVFGHYQRITIGFKVWQAVGSWRKA
jgi:hypothetical protein